MNTIPTHYAKNGFNYRLLERSAKAAIYEQLAGNRVVAYEVVRIRHRQGRTSMVGVKQVRFEAGEYLPGTEEWGTHGWTYSGKMALERSRVRYYPLNTISTTPHQDLQSEAIPPSGL